MDKVVSILSLDEQRHSVLKESLSQAMLQELRHGQHKKFFSTLKNSQSLPTLFLLLRILNFLKINVI